MKYLDTVKDLSARAQKVLDELGDELGLVVTYSGGRFNSKNAVLKFTFSTINSEGDAQSPEVEAFKNHAIRYGLSPDDLGREFMNHFAKWKVVGLNTRSRKYPIIGESNGQRKRFGSKYVKAMMIKKEAA